MPNRILVPLIVACALFMENLDSTVISTALPAIAADFGTSPIHLKLALTAYLLSIAVFLPASGWAADRLGARLVFRSAIFVFTAGSIFCGFSNSIGALVFARILQGLGGAMMVPIGRLVILRSVSKAELVESFAYLTVPALLGPVLGPPLGGFITTYFSWQWIFWINIPVGVLGFVLATLYIPDVRAEVRSNFDFAGFFLLALGLTSFMTGSTTLGLGLLPIWLVVFLLVAGAGLLAIYLIHSTRTDAPLLDLTLLRIPTFRYSLIGALLFRIGLGATPFLLPLLLQLGFGLSPFHSGLVTFSSAIGAITMKFVATPTLRRFGFRNTLLWNGLIASVFMALPAFFTSATPLLLMTGLIFIGGFFRSLQFTSINALSFADIPQERLSNATTLTSVTQQISLSVGISLGAIILETTTRITGTGLTASAFWPAFLVVGLVMVSSLVAFIRLDPQAGDELSGRVTPDPVTAMRERS